MIFDWKADVPPLPELLSEDTEAGRFYVTPAGRLPSITTVLGRTGDKEALKRWKERVGERSAEAIAKRARDAGSCLHNAVEELLRGWVPACEPEVALGVRRILRYLSDLDLIYHLEQPLYSAELRVAGRCDIIGMWRGKLSVIDLKTAWKMPKTVRHDYILQASAYAIMYNEITGDACEKVEQAAIITFAAGDASAVLIGEPEAKRDEIIARVREFHEAGAIQS
jgi:hypothetical protein